MNVTLDVDGDGLTDVVTCCWFSKEADWYRNTGSNAGLWPMYLGEKNGNYECGELWDIDGDGKALEILPDTKDTKWYEAGVKADGTRGLVKHVVSTDERPFGGGVGDINGDGRPDTLRPDAWYEAPADPRKGRWIEHPLAVGSLTEGQADHTPQICVYDVDADGLNDIITSSAHKHGIFWYEQIRTGKTISFKQHVIDKSWSQAHSITLSDMDADGDLDIVVTGKWGGPVFFENTTKSGR